MRAIDPAGSFRDVARENSWFAQHFQSDTCANDIDDGIHRADFVKVNLLGRHSVNFSFGDGNALKDCDGFFFHPIGKRAVANQRFDFRKISAVFVIMFIVMMFMLVFVMFVAVSV